MKNSMLIICFLSAFQSFGQAASEILLFDLQVKKNEVSISNPKNITNHKGYDNQPSFHTDKPIVYYASFNDEGRSDIKYYNYKTGETKALTKTSEREYSPTLTLDKQFISCIIQRDNGAQDLGKYPIEGGEALSIINNMIVGYHVWTDNSHLALFILGKENKPNTLHYLRLPTKSDTTIAENIGRSLHRVPNESAFSFVHKITESKWFIKKYNPRKSEISVITATLPNREDLCWTPDGKIIMSTDTKIFWMDPMKDKTWKEVQVSSGVEQLQGVTRLAVSADGKKMAVVIAE
jgi:Tol biopolymer transport system component